LDERDVHHVQFREAREIRHREMARAAVARRGVVSLPGFDLAYSTNSAAVLAGTAALAIST